MNADSPLRRLLPLALAAGLLAVARDALHLPSEDRAGQRRAMLAYAKPYSGHSPRVGAAQDMAAAGVSTAAILQAGGWADARMIKRYLRQRNALQGGMAQLFKT